MLRASEVPGAAPLRSDRLEGNWDRIESFKFQHTRKGPGMTRSGVDGLGESGVRAT